MQKACQNTQFIIHKGINRKIKYARIMKMGHNGPEKRNQAWKAANPARKEPDQIPIWSAIDSKKAPRSLKRSAAY